MTDNCSFCGQDEEHDPSEEFEEYLTCAVCGDHCTLICGSKSLTNPMPFIV